MWILLALLAGIGIALLIATIVMNFIDMQTRQYQKVTDVTVTASSVTTNALSASSPDATPNFRPLKSPMQGAFRFVRESMPWAYRTIPRRCVGIAKGVLTSDIRDGKFSVTVVDFPQTDAELAETTWTLSPATHASCQADPCQNNIFPLHIQDEL
jgi:hypothetical protein